MEITVRDAVTVIHGMFFGALLLLTFTGAVAGLYATSSSTHSWVPSPAQRKFISLYLVLMALLAWATVFLGAYAVYPWYRAIPAAGTHNLAAYPQRLLISNSLTVGWHDIGMEWKEHLAWFAPISLTAVAYLFSRYGTQLPSLKPLRHAVFGLVALAFASASIAGFFGAMLNKNAAVRGGAQIVIMRGNSR